MASEIDDRLVRRPEADPWALLPTEIAVLGKVFRRLIPFLFLLYVVNILDRVNIGFARLQMLEDLGLSEQVYAFGAGVFYLGYMLFEVPSNLILHRMGARRWISRIIISWGIVSACMMFVRGPWSFYALRVLLGVAEAGFFPGVILYISYWFPARERAKAVAFLMTGSPFSGVVGYPISGALMEHTDGLAGLAGWQWLFLVEGIPAVALGFVTWFYLTDRPEEARWLAPAERSWLSERMLREERRREERHGLSRLRALAHPGVGLLILLYFTIAMGTNGFGFYLPRILEGHFIGYGKSQLGLLSALPNVAAVIGMLLIGAHSDRTGERRWHVAGCALVAAAGWWLSAQARSPWLVLLSLTMVQVAMMGMMGPFWSMATSFLSGTGAAGGIALINTVANFGGFLSPNLIGQLKQASGSFATGQLAMAMTLLAGGVLSLCVRHDPRTDRA
jgi:ACS family tartrate transporter-like MFS transporter